MSIITYKAHSQISINIVLPNGHKKRVEFTPHTLGGSSYVSSDPDEQDALSKHYRFGSLFKISSVKIDKADVKEEGMQSESSEESEGNDRKDEDNGTSVEMKVVAVSSVADAKEYLAETFGIERTSIKYKKDIVEKATELGITFEWK